MNMVGDPLWWRGPGPLGPPLNPTLMLLAGVVEVNILPEEHHGGSFSGRGSNTQPCD